MTDLWYEIEADARGVETTRFDLSPTTYRTGAAGTRLVRQLLGLGIPDGALREIVEAAAAWVPHSPDWIAERFKPARLRESETGLVVEHLLRAIGLSWDEAREVGTVYRPPSSSTADLSARELVEAVWPAPSEHVPTGIGPEQRVVLIRIPRAYRAGMSADDLYEATRKWWRTNPNRHNPDYAFSVVRGKVLAVYRIDEWERESGGRWAFSGEQDSALEKRFVGSDVSEYFPPGAANPITYVNC